MLLQEVLTDASGGWESCHGPWWTDGAGTNGMTTPGLFRGQVVDLVGWRVGFSQRPRWRRLGRQVGAEKKEFKVFELDSTGYRNLKQEINEEVLSKKWTGQHRSQGGFALGHDLLSGETIGWTTETYTCSMGLWAWLRMTSHMQRSRCWLDHLKILKYLEFFGSPQNCCGNFSHEGH